LIDWVKHQRRDDYWKHGSVCEDYSLIKCPVYAVGGWSDSYTNSVLRLMQGLSGPRKAIIGPWGHQYPHQALPGPAIGYLQEALRWWDQWLKDTDTGILDEPMIRVWMQEYAKPAAVPTIRPGRWVAEPVWPPDADNSRVYHLTNKGLSDQPGAGSILINSAQTLGQTCVSWIGGGGGQPDEPTDQSLDDGGSVCFDLMVAEEFEILGTPKVVVEVASDKPNAILCARLCDVAPDGTSSRVSYGVLNLTHRDGHAQPTAMVPGKPYRVTVKLNDAARTFAAGHTLRLALSNAYWPVIWPSPEATNLTLNLADSRLLLPVRSPRKMDADLAEFGPAVCSPVQSQTPIRLALPQVVEVTRDVRTGQVTTRQVNDGGRFRIDASGWEYGSYSERDRVVAADNPATAECHSRAINEWGREGKHEFRIETEQVMQCNSGEFIIEASMRAYESDEPIFSRSWLERIPRDLV
ncbi:MAG: CocE/NonD family hydrolase, partial [Boseongicola sp.]